MDQFHIEEIFIKNQFMKPYKITVYEVHTGIYLKPDWNKLHPLSERLAPLGIVGVQLRASLKDLDTDTIVL